MEYSLGISTQDDSLGAIVYKSQDYRLMILGSSYTLPTARIIDNIRK